MLGSYKDYPWEKERAFRCLGDSGCNRERLLSFLRFVFAGGGCFLR